MRLILPYPKNKKERQLCIDIHLKHKKEGKLIPHFLKEGNICYLDKKEEYEDGSIRYAFRNINSKFANGAARRAWKLGQTPQLNHYIAVFGNELGKMVFKDEQLKIRQIYKKTPSATHDVDHVHSLASGGLHHSANLISLERRTNISEGARILSEEIKEKLQLYDDIITHISVHRVKPSDDVIRKIISGV
jgi:hypothetical protein